MALKIKDGQTVLFIGDSITDCGRRDAAAPLGNGYVKLFADLAVAREPAKSLSIINKGIGGDVVTGLRNRWKDDVLVHDPDWLSVKIGINDLSRTLCKSPEPVPPSLYREAYDEILSRTAAACPKCRVLLIQPFYISVEDHPDALRKRVLDLMPKYMNVVTRMSRKYGTRIVKTHAMFQRLLRYHDANTFCPEPVHPHRIGHMAIAEAVYATLSK